jgi:hypothetical protein
MPMQKYKIEYFHPLTIVDRWDELLPHIERLVGMSNGEFTNDSIRDRAVSGNSVLVAVSKDDKIIAVTTAEVVSYDSGLRSLLIPIVCGDEFMSWAPEWFEKMKELAVKFNCTELRGMAARDGWIRLLKPYGWHENHVVITCQLNEELK